MKKKALLFAIAAILPGILLAAIWPKEYEPSTISKRIAKQFLSTDPLCYKPQGYRGSGYFAKNGYGDNVTPHYSVVSLWVNAMECARKSNDWETLKKLVDLFEGFYRESRFAVTPIRHVDFTVFGALPAEIFLNNGDMRAARMAIDFAERQWEKPGPKDAYPWYFSLPPLEERMAWWEQGYSSQTRLWIDDMYMITFLQTQAYRITGDKKYLERAAKEMALYLDRIQLTNGLFNHSPEGPFTWARGNGWMAGGMTLLLEYLPKDNEYYKKILSGYKLMMSTLLKYQRESGLWGQIVDDRESWDETSGSAMFAYAFQSGVNHGLLQSGEYAQAARRAYLALVAKLDEHANIADVCEGTGPKNDRNHYLERARVNGDPHGQSPMLWLCSAMLDAELSEPLMKTVENIRFRTDVDSTNCWLKVKFPVGKTKFPTLLWLHGGGLTAGKAHFRDLSDNGIAQVTVNYRFLGETDADGVIDDAAAAIAWTIKNIESFGGDKTQVYVAGHSAGGYLTLMAGMDEKRLAKYGLSTGDIKALISVSGQVTKHFAVRKTQGDDDPSLLPKIDKYAPLYYARSESAPIMLVCGDREKEYPCRVEENEFFAISRKKLNIDGVKFIEYPGRDHVTIARAANMIIRDIVRGKSVVPESVFEMTE